MTSALFELGQPLTDEVLRQYEDLSRSAWQQLGKEDESKICCDEFISVLEHVGIIIYDSRAHELFSACAQTGEELMDMTDFEIALMVNDAVREEDKPSLQEVFNTFDVDRCGRLSLRQYLQACYSLGHKEHVRLTEYFFGATKKSKSGRLEYNDFVRIWCNKLSDAVDELQRRELVYRETSNPFCRPLVKRNARCHLYKVLLTQTSLSSLYVDARKKIMKMRADLRRSKDEAKRKMAAKKQRRERAAATASSHSARQRRSSVQREEYNQAELEQLGNLSTRELRIEQELAKCRSDEAIKRSRDEAKQKELTLLRRADDKLSIRHANLSSIPLSLYDGESLQSLSSILVLDLSDNKLSSLPMAFAFNLVSLRKLCLSTNCLKQLSELESMQQLQILEADCNVLESLPDSMPRSLLHLDVARNKLTSLGGICALDSLVSFVAHSNLISQLPSNFGELSCLEVLNLSNNQISSLPESFPRLAHLVKADFHSNAINDMPTGCHRLLSLEHMDLSFNKIQELPASLADLARLTIVKAGNNSLTELPACICKCSSMLSLEFGNNDIREVDSSIGNLSCLQQLLLPGNKIVSLPKELGLLTDCITLGLRNNCIAKLPVEVGALGASLLRVDASYNELTELPPSFCLLTSLTYLDLSHNKLHCLPKALGALAHLEHLDVSHNAVEQIPPSAKDLSSLKILLANSNRISLFSADILRGLERLERISLCSNRLDTLPLELVKVGLEVEVGNNPFQLLLLKSMPLKGKQDFELVDNPTAVSWLQEEAVLHSTALSQWNSTAACCDDLSFIQGVREKLDISEQDPKWKDMFLRFLCIFARESRAHGAPPGHDDLKEMVIRERERDMAVTRAKRREDAEKAKEDDMCERRRLDEVYYLNLEGKMEAASATFSKRADESKRAEVDELITAIAHRVGGQDARAAWLAQEQMHKHEKEVEALISHVGSTAPGSGNVTPKRTLPLEIDPCWNGRSHVAADQT